MSANMMKLVDPLGKVLAVVQVADEGEHYGGTIDLSETPDCVRTLFVDFEETINGQMFSYLDEIQGKVASLGLKAVSDNGLVLAVKDLQVYPSSGEVSFKLGNPSV